MPINCILFYSDLKFQINLFFWFSLVFHHKHFCYLVECFFFTYFSFSEWTPALEDFCHLQHIRTEESFSSAGTLLCYSWILNKMFLFFKTEKQTFNALAFQKVVSWVYIRSLVQYMLTCNKSIRTRSVWFFNYLSEDTQVNSQMSLCWNLLLPCYEKILN